MLGAMNVIPAGREAQIQFARTHAAVWEIDPAAIGLTPEVVAAIAAQARAASEARAAASRAAQAARAATLLADIALATLNARVRGAVRSIKAFALARPDPARVLSLAQIPVPANLLATPRTPLAPPTRPEHVDFTLRADGALVLSWTSRRASTGDGSYFVVQRRLDGERDFTDIGVAPGSTKESRTISFVDATLPIGARGAAYIIEGRRGRARGEPTAALNITFGSAPGAALRAAA
jgi:hypothetical protein